MKCAYCGREITDQVNFCPGCGAQVEAAVNQPTSPVSAEQPASQTSAPVAPSAQAAAKAPEPAPKRKRRTGCMVFVVLILIVLAVGAYFAASTFGLLPPPDMGVTYTEADYQSAMKKIGTEITFDGKSGAALRTYTQELKKSGTKLNYKDYNWQHSDFQEKTFELTSAEATALVNEIAPAFYWFENQQIKAGTDGQVQASGTLLLGKAIDELYPSLKSQVPFPILPKVNLSAAGGISIRENKLSLSAREFKTGPIPGITPQMLNENASYAESLYKSVPGLIIHKLDVTSAGKIAVSALIPQKTVVTKK